MTEPRVAMGWQSPLLVRTEVLCSLKTLTLKSPENCCLSSKAKMNCLFFSLSNVWPLLFSFLEHYCFNKLPIWPRAATMLNAL